MKLHRDLGVRQATAWFMLHRIREAFAGIWIMFDGPVEVFSGQPDISPRGLCLAGSMGASGPAGQIFRHHRACARAQEVAILRARGWVW